MLSFTDINFTCKFCSICKIRFPYFQLREYLCEVFEKSDCNFCKDSNCFNNIICNSLQRYISLASKTIVLFNNKYNIVPSRPLSNFSLPDPDSYLYNKYNIVPSRPNPNSYKHQLEKIKLLKLN